MSQLTLILLFVSVVTYSQDLKERIQGSWICDKIIDSNGEVLFDKFSDSGYLRYTFENKQVMISDSPFSTGNALNVVFNNENLLMLYSHRIQKKNTYEVKLISENNLIFSTTDENQGAIEFNFIKQKKLLIESSIDNGLIIVEHFKKSENAKVTMRSSVYKIRSNSEKESNPEILYPSPIFKDKFDSFENFITRHFSFPKDYPLNTFSEELIVEFDISGNGVSNIKLVQGLSYDINNMVTKLIEKTTKKWDALEISGHPVKTTVRFHFVFLLGLADLELLK